MIFQIAKNELRNMFCSPIAWLVLFIFAVQTGIEFTGSMAMEVRDSVMGVGLYRVTANCYSGIRGLFSSLQGSLFLYVPLLTMGLMSRERSSGSIKLLYSSPVSNSSIILGKYISLLIYNLILICILLIYVFLGLCIIENVDFWLPFSGLVGLYLIVCTYAAIGLYMSSITSYQVVAALGTLAVLAILNYLPSLGGNIEVVQEITYWFSISGKANQMIDGLICSEDLFYFFIVIGLFLSLSVLKLHSERKVISKSRCIVTCIGILTFVLLLEYVCTRPACMWYCDVTQDKSRTLSKGSQEVMKALDGGLTITTYVNLLDDHRWQGLPANRVYDVRGFRQFTRFKPEIQMRYVYYYDQTDNPILDKLYPNLSMEERARELARVEDLDFDKFLSPEEIREKIDLTSEGNRFVRLLERENGRKTFLRIYNDGQANPGEREIIAALKRLTIVPPKVGFLTGHDERSIRQVGEWDYSAFAANIGFRYSLVNIGFDVEEVDLRDTIPGDIHVLVIADLKKPLTDDEQEYLQRYVDKGGNLFILATATRQELLNPVTRSLGVYFEPGILVQNHKQHQQDLILGEITSEAIHFSPEFFSNKASGKCITMPRSVAINCNGQSDFRITPILETSAKGCWNEQETIDFVNQVATLGPGEQEKSYPLMVMLDREVGSKKQHILVVGCADCISNGELTRTRNDVNSNNYSLIMESFRVLGDGVFPVDVSRPAPVDNAIKIGETGLIVLKWFALFILPLGIVMGGVWVWRRRRK